MEGRDLRLSVFSYMFMANNLGSCANGRHPLNTIILQTPMITLYPSIDVPTGESSHIPRISWHMCYRKRI